MTSSRDARREATHERIRAAARALFGDHGFERTTIRAVAAAAGVDPALVMQHFGTKQDLFLAAVRAAPDPAFAGHPDELAGFLAETMRLKLGPSDEAPTPMLRSMLTHPDATARARDVLDDQVRQITAALDGDDAQLRAALVTATMLGVRVARDLLELEGLADASPDAVAAALAPVFDALTRGES